VQRLFHRLLVWGVNRLDSDRPAVPVEGSPARWLYHHLRPGGPYLTGFLALLAIFQSWGLSATGLVAWFLKSLGHVLHRPFNPQSEHPVSLWSILLAVVYVVAAFLLSKYLRRGLERFVYSRPHVAWDRGIRHAVSTTVHYAIIVFGLLKGLQSLGLSLADLTVLSAAFGVGLGFGLQDIFKNFISGTIMLVERPVKIGDYVNVSGTLGNVTNISTRSTTITTPDNTTLIVPNATFVTTNITNWSYGEETVKLHVPVNVTSQVDMATVRETMLRVLDQVEGLVAEPAPQVLCTALTGSGFSFDLQVWTRIPERSQEIISHIHFALEASFREAGIELK
jgi:small-conductance mechanosensitive channel